MVLLVLGIAGGTAGFFVLDVPNWQPLDVSRITAAPQTGRMYDGEGQLIMTIKGSQNRVVIPFDDIPEQTRNVFLAAEDLRFYRHHGVDMVRLLGALAANIREGGYSQGASTITMQLIRQSHLSTKKTLSRKAEEIWLAWQLERRMSKDDILAMYLNYIYFGNGAYGIQAAAQTYFGVDARDLTLTQACALAASIKAPSYYAPHVSAQHNRSRRNYILNIMLEEGMIDQQTRDEAAAETLVLAEVLPEKVPYGWYADAVLDEAETLLGMTSEEVLSGGLSIDTALSRTHQDLLDKQFTADIFPANASDGTKVQGAAACVDTNTGEVLAIVGGRSYDVRRGFNRATRLRRQPGSALKPLAVYAPAIDRYGYMTCSVLKDRAHQFQRLQAPQFQLHLLRQRQHPHGAEKQPERLHRGFAQRHRRNRRAGLHGQRWHSAGRPGRESGAGAGGHDLRRFAGAAGGGLRPLWQRRHLQRAPSDPPHPRRVGPGAVPEPGSAAPGC